VYRKLQQQICGHVRVVRHIVPKNIFHNTYEVRNLNDTAKIKELYVIGRNIELL